MVAKKNTEGIVLKKIMENPYVSTERLKELLEGELSNGPINDALRELSRKGMIYSDKKRPNERGNRWSPRKDNPVTTFNSMMSTFELDFWRLFDKSIQIAKDPTKLNFRLAYKADYLNPLLRTLELFMEFVYVCNMLSLFTWPEKIKDERIRTDLIASNVSFLATLQTKIANRLDHELGQGARGLPKSLGAQGVEIHDTQDKMYAAYKLFKVYGLNVEARQLLDMIWKAQEYMGPRYDWFKAAKAEEKRLTESKK